MPKEMYYNEDSVQAKQERISRLLKEAKRRLTPQSGLQQLSARHGVVKHKKRRGGLKKRGVKNTEMLNITLIIKQAFSWGPHSSTI